MMSRIFSRNNALNYLSRLARPHYFHCVEQAARQAKALGLPAISVLEVGVAGGAGLKALERIAADVSQRHQLSIEVYGFDTGEGLPEPQGYRDLPYHWQTGFYKMDVEKLRRSLTGTKLVLGDVRETMPEFFNKYQPAPIGAVMIDVDFYSSTVDALRFAEGPSGSRIPRVFCYFDDVIGGPIELYNEYTGELAAIREFNEKGDTIKLSKVKYLRGRFFSREWHDQIYALHDFSHALYGQFVSERRQELPLPSFLARR
jgi:hypothetical protein